MQSEGLPSAADERLALEPILFHQNNSANSNGSRNAGLFGEIKHILLDQLEPYLQYAQALYKMNRILESLSLFLKLYTRIIAVSKIDAKILDSVVFGILKCYFGLNDPSGCRKFIQTLPGTLFIDGNQNTPTELGPKLSYSESYLWVGMSAFMFSKEDNLLLKKAQKCLLKAIFLNSGERGGYSAWTFIVDHAILSDSEQFELLQVILRSEEFKKGKRSILGDYLRLLYVSKVCPIQEITVNSPTLILNIIQRAYKSFDYSVCVDLLKK